MMYHLLHGNYIIPGTYLAKKGMICMRNPNGYGSVYKLSGKRRRPFAVRLTTGWTDEGKQTYEYLGYFKTRKEALVALADYNKHPFDLDGTKLTFSDIYEKWSDERYPKFSSSNVHGYSAAYKFCTSIDGVIFKNLRKNHLQNVIDLCNRGYPTRSRIKILFSQLYKFALENDIASKDYSKFVSAGENQRKNPRKPFSSSEIKKLWTAVHKTQDKYIEIVLMLIYSGVRISELLSLQKENIHLEDRYFEIVSAKTEAGVRKVPIAKKTLPFFENWIKRYPESEMLLCNGRGLKMRYNPFLFNQWKPLMGRFDMQHKPHDTRHTTISLMAQQNINQTIIKSIVGHKGAMSLTEKVYTHFDIESLLKAIDSI
jgi:integrase